MPSPRRMRLVMSAALILVIFIFFYSSRLDDRAQDDHRTIQDFYHKTVNAMDDRYSAGKSGQGIGQAGLLPADRDDDGDVDDEDKQIGANTQDRLKAAADKAKEKANEKAGLRPDPPSNVIGVGSSADGQDKKGAVKGSGAGDSGSSASDGKVSEAERDAEAELNMILKKSPIIIFSKTYCRFSQRAKQILLDKYLITPQPYVIELDEHPMLSSLQAALREKTGRKTVPNILVNGVSIGGADEISDLDAKGLLTEKLVDLGNNRVEVVRRPASRGSSLRY